MKTVTPDEHSVASRIAQVIIPAFTLYVTGRSSSDDVLTPE